jgi:two-component system KDP operon response regulator KdpE
MPRILVVDDDPQIRDALGVVLSLQWPSLEIVTASGGDEAVRAFFAHEPDVVLLDVSRPGLSGFEVLRQIRPASDVPVIMLTGRGEETDQVRGLELGADDYVVKPFGALALTARIRAVLRRTECSPLARGVPDFTAGSLTISFDSRQVSVHGQVIHLTPVEFRLLYHLARNAGHLLTHDALLNRIWGPDSYRTADHLKVYVSRLRSKIDRAGGPRCIENERGLGYRLVRPPALPIVDAPIARRAEVSREGPSVAGSSFMGMGARPPKLAGAGR